MSIYMKELNQRNLGLILQSFEPQELGAVLAQALTASFGRGRAETILLDGQDWFKRGDGK